MKHAKEDRLLASHCEVGPLKISRNWGLFEEWLDKIVKLSNRADLFHDKELDRKSH